VSIDKNNKPIPKNIFQTWGQKNLSPALQEAASSWQKFNPDWQITIFDDKQCREFIATHFDEDVLWAYDQITPGAYRADLWRYCVLYVHGGVYADFKFKALLPLDKVLDPAADFVSVIDVGTPDLLGIDLSKNPYLMQGFLASKPNSLVFLTAIQAIVHHVKQGDYTTDYLSITGPGLMGRVVNQQMGRDELNSYEAGIFQAGEHTYQFLPAWNLEKNIFIDKRGQPFIDRSCPGYRKALAHRSKVVNDYDVAKGHYARCWFLGLVYKHGKVHYPPMNAQQQATFDLGKKKAVIRMVKFLGAAGASQKAHAWFKKCFIQYGFSFKCLSYLLQGKLTYLISRLGKKQL
jgi:hypothetical protein